MFDFLKRKAKNKDRVEVVHWSSNELLRHCLRSLRGECTVADAPYQEAVAAAVFLAKNADWVVIDSIDDLPEAWKNGSVYILWEDEVLPCLRCSCRTVLEQIGDVKAVTPEVYLVSENMDRFIQFRHNGEIRLYPYSPELE